MVIFINNFTLLLNKYFSNYNLNKDVVSQITGISKSMIYKILNGESYPSRKNYLALVNKLLNDTLLLTTKDITQLDKSYRINNLDEKSKREIDFFTNLLKTIDETNSDRKQFNIKNALQIEKSLPHFVLKDEDNIRKFIESCLISAFNSEHVNIKLKSNMIFEIYEPLMELSAHAKSIHIQHIIPNFSKNHKEITWLFNSIVKTNINGIYEPYIDFNSEHDTRVPFNQFILINDSELLIYSDNLQHLAYFDGSDHKFKDIYSVYDNTFSDEISKIPLRPLSKLIPYKDSNAYCYNMELNETDEMYVLLSTMPILNLPPEFIKLLFTTFFENDPNTQLDESIIEILSRRAELLFNANSSELGFKKASYFTSYEGIENYINTGVIDQIKDTIQYPPLIRLITMASLIYLLENNQEYCLYLYNLKDHSYLNSFVITMFSNNTMIYLLQDISRGHNSDALVDINHESFVSACRTYIKESLKIDILFNKKLMDTHGLNSFHELDEQELERLYRNTLIGDLTTMVKNSIHLTEPETQALKNMQEMQRANPNSTDRLLEILEIALKLNSK